MRISKQILYPIFCFLARHRMPRIAAWILLLTSSTIRGDGVQQQRHRVLALNVNKPGVLQDIEETFLKSDDFEVVRWPNFTLRAFADTILSPALNNKFYQTNDPAIEATKLEYRHFLAQMWQHLSAIKPIHAAVSPNYGYYVQRELAAALEENGVPFIVLHKENLKSSGRLEYWQTVYEDLRGTFSGRKILVYNETERALQISGGVTDPEKIIITGMPRLDRIHNWRQNSAKSSRSAPRRQVLFFAFDKKDKLPTSRRKRAAHIENRWGELSWGNLCEKTHMAMTQVAHERPDIKVVVKTKTNSRHQTEVIKMLTAGGQSLPSNLEIVTGGDAFELLAESSVVVGFNTTAQLEALAAGKPVVTPWFDEAIEPNTREFVIDLGNSVEYARSPAELGQLICRFADNPDTSAKELSPDVRQALLQWTGNDDGGSGHRVLDVVRHEIERAKS
jgi:hypothetical protein